MATKSRVPSMALALATAACLAGTAAVADTNNNFKDNNEPLVTARFTQAVGRAFRTARSATMTRAMLTGVAIFVVFASVVVVLWVGAQDVLDGTISPGRLGQFVLYTVLAAGALGELSQVWGELTQASGAAERLFEILAAVPAIKPPAARTTPAVPISIPRAMALPPPKPNMSRAYARELRIRSENRSDGEVR